jgi:hypothetical protein
VAKRKDAAGLKLVTEEAQDAERRFNTLFDKANRKDARPADVDALRRHMRDHADEKLWRHITAPMGAAEEFTLSHVEGINPGVAAVWREQIADMSQRLRGENPSEAERLLARHAALCWLRLAETEIQFAAHTSGSHTLTAGAYWDKRLTLAQRRFTRAVETLERVRMMRRRAGQIGGAQEGERRRA